MKQKIRASLNSLRLDAKLMQKVKGGDCRCSCSYADTGGSSVNANHKANRGGGEFGGLHSPGSPDHD